MASKQATIQDVGKIALQIGMSPQEAQVAMAIAQTEGGLGGKVGDSSIGGSYGPFQFYTKGVLPSYAEDRGLTTKQAGQYAIQNPLDAIKWALTGYLGQAIRQGRQKGLTGAELATYVQQNGQRSVNPERAGAVYNSLFGAKGGAKMDPTKDEVGPGGILMNPGAGAGGQTAYDTGYSGVDDSIARMYTQKQNQKKQIQAAMDDAVRELARAKGEVARLSGLGKMTGDLDYGKAVEDQAAAENYVKQLEKTDAELTNSMQQLEQDQITANQRSAAAKINYAKQLAAASRQGYKDYLAEAVAMGKIATDQAKEQFDQADAQSKNWISALSNAYSTAAQIAPKMASQTDVDALWAELQGLGSKTRYGGGTGAAPKVVNLESIMKPYTEAIRQYMPPANSIDWKQAMNVPSGLGQPGMTPEDYATAATAGLEEPMDIAPLPGGGYSSPSRNLTRPVDGAGMIPPLVQSGIDRLGASGGNGLDINGPMPGGAGAGAVPTTGWGPADALIAELENRPPEEDNPEVVPGLRGAQPLPGPMPESVAPMVGPQQVRRPRYDFEGLGQVPGTIAGGILGGLGAVGGAVAGSFKQGASGGVDPAIQDAWLKQRKPGDPYLAPAGWRP